MNKQQQEGLRKLAAAIRKGSELYPPCNAHMFERLSLSIVACCALGAAWAAAHSDWSPLELLNWEANLKSFSEVDRHFGVEDLFIPFPQDVADLHFTPLFPVSEVVWKLNDLHEYARGRVADYLEQVAEEIKND